MRDAAADFLRPLFDGLDRFDGFSGSGAFHYAGCALAFTLAGLICGYFIWRKGHMQTLDAETEVGRTAAELDKLRDDLRAEEESLGG